MTPTSVSIRRSASCTCNRARQFVTQPWPDTDWWRLRYAAAGRGIGRRAGAASRIACAAQTGDRRETWPITENCDWRVPIRPVAKQDESFVKAAREYPMSNVRSQTWRRAEPPRHVSRISSPFSAHHCLSALSRESASNEYQSSRTPSRPSKSLKRP